MRVHASQTRWPCEYPKRRHISEQAVAIRRPPPVHRQTRQMVRSVQDSSMRMRCFARSRNPYDAVAVDPKK